MKKPLGFSAKTIYKMCEKGLFKGTYKTAEGNWQISGDNFVTIKEQDKRIDEFFKKMRKPGRLRNLILFKIAYRKRKK